MTSADLVTDRASAVTAIAALPGLTLSKAEAGALLDSDLQGQELIDLVASYTVENESPGADTWSAILAVASKLAAIVGAFIPVVGAIQAIVGLVGAAKAAAAAK